MIEFTSKNAHPFQLTEFLDHIRLVQGVDDTAAQRSLDAAVEAFENWTGLLTRRCTLLQTADNHTPPFRASYGPFIDATTTVTKIDRTVDPAVSTNVTDKFYIAKDTFYYLMKIPRASVSYTRCSFRWQYDAGSTSFPATVKMAIHGIGALFYENRELANECSLDKVPVAYRSIIESYRNGDM